MGCNSNSNTSESNGSNNSSNIEENADSTSSVNEYSHESYVFFDECEDLPQPDLIIDGINSNEENGAGLYYYSSSSESLTKEYLSALETEYGFELIEVDIESESTECFSAVKDDIEKARVILGTNDGENILLIRIFI